MSRRLISLGLACLIAFAPGPAWGALGFGDIVFDPTNYVENLATAVSTAATLTEAIQITENTLLNIASLEEVILIGSPYMAELEELWAEAEGVLRAMQRVADNFEALFGTDNLPVTAYAYHLRRSEIFEYKRDAAWYATRVQQLIGSTIQLIDRIGRLLRSIPALVGGKQATLTAVQAQLDTVRQLQQSEVRQAALDHLKVIESMDEASAIESLKRINEDTFKNW
jgi:type IV secretion system protein TrbJ